MDFSESGMINGEGTRESSTEVASPESLEEFSRKSDYSDASPAPSQYSSCGESEFERYCSANSAMGTPSLCSSFGTFHECLDSELVSVKSFGPGEISGLDNFSLGGRFDRNHEDQRLSPSGSFDCLGDRGTESCKGKIDYNLGISVELGDGLVKIGDGSNLYDNGNSSFLHQTTLPTSGDTTYLKVGNGSTLLRPVDLNADLVEGVYGEGGDEDFIPCKGHGKSGLLQSTAENASTEETTDPGIVEGNLFDHGYSDGPQFSSGVGGHSLAYMVAEQVDNGFDGLNSKSNFQFDGTETGRLSVEDGTSSRCEHSEDEDSMYNYGADDEHKFGIYCRENLQHRQDAKAENGNPLVMNSSIAFGSEDWDDFVQETGESALASVTLNNFLEQKQENLEIERSIQNSTSVTLSGFLSIGEPEQSEDARDIPVASNHVQGANELDKLLTTSVILTGVPDSSEQENGNVRNIPETTDQLGGTDDSSECLESCIVSNIFENEQDPLKQKGPLEVGLNIMDGEAQYINPERVIGIDVSQLSESQVLENSTTQLDPLSNITISQFSPSTEAPENNMAELIEDRKPDSFLSMFDNNILNALKDSSKSVDLFEDQPASIKIEDLELNHFYDEIVHEMEEILLDSVESPEARFHQGSQLSLPSRDGGSTASTSGTDDAYPLIWRPLRIDGVEVVGAKQKKGDVSLGERLVGVKEYTVYKLRAWNGEDQWEVERRYRDFCTLYRRLKSFYTDQGWTLPSPWSSVERESRKIFGNASPDVIAERSALIHECLQSVLHSRFPSSLPGALIWFLSPQKAVPSSPASNTTPVPWFTLFSKGTDREAVTTFGKTISLVVEVRPYKSIKQMLEAQHYTCAGCHKYFDDGKTRIREFVQTFGWGKPRLCEYTGQLFCSSCHTNDTAVLPARVLHHWDFTEYPVSQLAKSYLDSIHAQPMLCVSAVNPFLFSKVPALLLVMGVRKKIGAMLPYVRCPFRRSIHKGLASRRYLLESNDFFALRDLIDLSKGVFAALPVMVESLSNRILEHITEQCLICCDVGVPCGARQACDDPSSLIFPFQEGEVDRCRSCDLVFHKSCFKRLTDCPCGANLKADEAMRPTNEAGQKDGGDADGTLELLRRKVDSRSPVGFLPGLFSRARQEKRWGPKDSDTVILMGSLPSTSF